VFTPFQASLSESELLRVARYVEDTWRWVRSHEPSETAEEDLLCHRLRTLLVQLQDGAAVGKRSRVLRAVRSIQSAIYDLTLQRVRRGRKS
jgi:hypothetical protein